ncbi:hypothetical protein IAG44_17270 [Streptomyces roseirectus]|uniref:Uncharacterized protein n=1 Tax=Streptomyces roseirectus TaxID=2768066 RepID=A0A7H0ISP6_9ACTN|nr:hypothetical protein [Streptomyces roseirectus]QNP75812.1 hypothetical protein IAG44_17270 [Streptomyces roseirectus]
MAFGAEELRVLRRALALALHPGPASAEDIQDCHRLATSLDEALREAARLRTFLVADLVRYRAALPGTAAGYLTLLEEVLGTGYRPEPDDLAALRALRGNPLAATLLSRCQVLAEQDVRSRLARRTTRHAVPAPLTPTPAVPASRTRLLALPGGLSPDSGFEGAAPQEPAAPAERPKPRPAGEPAPSPSPDPARRPIPTPGEVFPRRKPAQPPADPEERAAG